MACALLRSCNPTRASATGGSANTNPGGTTPCVSPLPEEIVEVRELAAAGHPQIRRALVSKNSVANTLCVLFRDLWPRRIVCNRHCGVHSTAGSSARHCRVGRRKRPPYIAAQLQRGAGAF